MSAGSVERKRIYHKQRNRRNISNIFSQRESVANFQRNLITRRHAREKASNQNHRTPPGQIEIWSPRELKGLQ